MLTPTTTLLHQARTGGYAVGAFNVYNLEGVRAVVAAAEAVRSPAILQIHPSALEYGGAPLVSLCLEAARQARISMSIHLDHSASADDIRAAIAGGCASVMADGARLPYEENVRFTRDMCDLAHAHGAAVEAELGLLTGTEDGLTVPEYEARFTDPAEASDFVGVTNVDSLAVCIGNVHGHYRGEPILDFERLAEIRERVSVPLVLHGASGLPEGIVRRAIELGVCKFNVNTEVRAAYVNSLRESLSSFEPADLLKLMRSASAAMQAIVADKLRLFDSIGKE